MALNSGMAHAVDEFQTRPTLLARVRDRADAESWREFYGYYQPLLMRYLHRLGLKEHAADDVIQEVFARLLRTLPEFTLGGKPGRFRGYLWKVTFSSLVDQARQAKAQRQAEEEWVRRFREADESESRKVQEEWDQMEAQHRLEMAMQRVRAVTSARSWACFEQRVLRDRPAAAIAPELEVTANAVFVYASRVLKAVRRECAALAEELGDEPDHGLPGGS
jgi:RNA polymerase sigma factor (sigma-70 family)